MKRFLWGRRWVAEPAPCSGAAQRRETDGDTPPEAERLKRRTSLRITPMRMWTAKRPLPLIDEKLRKTFPQFSVFTVIAPAREVNFHLLIGVALVDAVSNRRGARNALDVPSGVFRISTMARSPFYLRLWRGAAPFPRDPSEGEQGTPCFAARISAKTQGLPWRPGRPSRRHIPSVLHIKVIGGGKRPRCR